MRRIRTRPDVRVQTCILERIGAWAGPDDARIWSLFALLRRLESFAVDDAQNLVLVERAPLN